MDKEDIKDILRREILGQDNLLSADLSSTHLLFHGPAGSGKSSAAKIITRGATVLYMNASTERGIGSIRSRIKPFAAFGHNKFVVLDECDNLTPESQDALKGIVESSLVRFIFICNYVTSVIPAIQSRCACIEFVPVSEEICMHLLPPLPSLPSLSSFPSEFEDRMKLVKRCKGDVRLLRNLSLEREKEKEREDNVEIEYCGNPMRYATTLSNKGMALLPILARTKVKKASEEKEFQILRIMYAMAQQSDKSTCGPSRDQNILLFARGIEIAFS